MRQLALGLAFTLTTVFACSGNEGTGGTTTETSASASSAAGSTSSAGVGATGAGGAGAGGFGGSGNAATGTGATGSGGTPAGTGATGSGGSGGTPVGTGGTGSGGAPGCGAAPPTTADSSPPERPGGDGRRFDGQPPGQGGLHASALDDTGIHVYWWPAIDDVGIAQYCVLRADGETFMQVGFTEIGCMQNVTTYLDTTVTPGALYTYAVVAKDFAGNQSPWMRSAGHDGMPRALVAGMTRSMTITAPAQVGVGQPIDVVRHVDCSPACRFGHNDLHATMDMDIPYLTDPRLPPLPPGSWMNMPVTSDDFTFSFVAPSVAGDFYFYPEAHFGAVNGWNPVDADMFDQGLTYPWMKIKVVENAPLQVEPPSLPSATVGTPYNAMLSASGDGQGPYELGVMHGGWLPSGLTLSRDGALTGTPTEAGTYCFTVRVEELGGAQAERNYVIQVL